MIKRIFYLGYYFKELDWSKLNTFMNYVKDQHQISKFSQWKSIISSSLKYNISILEYYLFGFYKITDKEKHTFAGTGYMYEYQKLMNPKSERAILNDKLQFLKAYKPFVKHNFIAINELENTEKLNAVLGNPSGKIVFKDSVGQCGVGVEVLDSKDLDKNLIHKKLVQSQNDFIEDFIQQHDDLNGLSPSGLNTVRIITQINVDGNVEILGARLRITINSSVDNLAAGNIAAPIDLNTGMVCGKGAYSDITKIPVEIHPITNQSVIGFQVPYWNESLNMVKEAALLHKQNRSIGWDVAITNSGPELLEGNHDWCKLLWQLPVQKGLKPVLEKHKQEFLQKT